MSPDPDTSVTDEVSSRYPLAGRVGIVTGGGKGLGRAFALSLAAAGANVVVNNRNRRVDDDERGPADHVVSEIIELAEADPHTGQAVAQYSDVTDPAAAAAMLELALSRWGRIDFLIANAAVSAPAMFHKSTPEQFDQITAVNIGGAVHLAMLCSARMRAAEFGRIVLISSTAGLYGEPTASAYTASKGALIALGRAIAVEGERRNVLTNIVLPYATTQMTNTGMNPQYRSLMTAESVAPVVTTLVDPRSSLNGQVLVVAGGGLRAATNMEFATVHLPDGPLDPLALTALIAESRSAPPKEFPEAQSAFLDLAADLTDDQAPGARADA